MRQQSIHVLLFSTKGQNEKSESKGRYSERKSKIKRGSGEGKERGHHERKRECERNGVPSACLRHQSNAEKLCQTCWNGWIILRRRGLKSGCCGDATVHLCLLRGQPVYSPKPHKAPENHRTRHCEH